MCVTEWLAEEGLTRDYHQLMCTFRMVKCLHVPTGEYTPQKRQCWRVILWSGSIRFFHSIEDTGLPPPGLWTCSSYPEDNCVVHWPWELPRLLSFCWLLPTTKGREPNMIRMGHCLSQAQGSSCGCGLVCFHIFPMSRKTPNSATKKSD